MTAATLTAQNRTPVAQDTKPDLERDIGGYAIRLFYLPTQEAPERAVIEVHAGPVLLDVVDVPAAEGYDAYIHTSGRSHALAEGLR